MESWPVPLIKNWQYSSLGSLVCIYGKYVLKSEFLKHFKKVESYDFLLLLLM